MKQDVADLWVDALRSGIYPQGKEQLGSAAGFCCLGVLCDLYLAFHPNDEGWNSEHIHYRFHDETGYPPESVVEWSGMGTRSGEVPGDKSSLAQMNDRGGSFDVISEFIEKYVNEL